MSKKVVLTICIAAFALCSGALRAYSQRSQKFVVDKVVANVGNSTILYSEVVDAAAQLQQQRKEMGYTSDRDPFNEALESLMLQKLLYNQALIDSITVNNDHIGEMVENRIGQMLNERGSVAALEALYHKPIFDIKSDIRRRYEEASYAQSMRGEIEDKVTITPGEVERFFKSLPKDSLPLVPEQYVYAHITKFPATTKEAKQRVRERLLDMRERIINGTSFEMLARMYSIDGGSAVRGGEMDPSPAEGFVAPFRDALKKLKPGQISEVVETEYGFHIIQLIDVKGNLYHCRHILIRPQFTFEELAGSDKFLDSLVTEIKAGKTTFEKAAAEYSDDPYSKRNGGLVSNYEMLEMYQAYDASLTSTRFYKEDLPPDVYRVLSTMKPGDISKAFQSTDMRGNVLSRVVKLVSVVPSHPANMQEDYLKLEEIALYDKKSRVFNEWVKRKIGSMYVRVAPEYRNGDFENKAWIK